MCSEITTDVHVCNQHFNPVDPFTLRSEIIDCHCFRNTQVKDQTSSVPCVLCTTCVSSPLHRPCVPGTSSVSCSCTPVLPTCWSCSPVIQPKSWTVNCSLWVTTTLCARVPGSEPGGPSPVLLFPTPVFVRGAIGARPNCALPERSSLPGTANYALLPGLTTLCCSRPVPPLSGYPVQVLCLSPGVLLRKFPSVPVMVPFPTPAAWLLKRTFPDDFHSKTFHVTFRVR